MVIVCPGLAEATVPLAGVPLGNLVFAPLMDAIGARWVLLGGAALSGGVAKDLERPRQGAALRLAPRQGSGRTRHGQITQSNM